LAGLAADQRVAQGEPPAHVPPVLARLLAAGDPRASAVVRRYAEPLTHLIATLTGEPQAGLATQSAWRTAYLHHWAGIEQVWLAGGLAAALGEPLAGAVADHLAALGRQTPLVRLAPQAAHLALLGAARSRPLPRGQRLVFDFGQTAAKRAVADYRGRQVARLSVLPSRAAPDLSATLSPDAIVAFVADVLAETLAMARPVRLDPHCTVSIACYTHAGRPLDRRGTYAPLGRLPLEVIAAAVSERTGQPLRLRFVHDGTLAARVLAGHRPSALIVLGTYVGVGFPPAAEQVLPLAADFVLDQPMTADTVR
jgi:predicted NBD/HSP70 family sugar kinase